MIGGLWNGRSGLITFEKALNVESNNTTNVNTIGHKADEVRFADLLYENGYGKGSTIDFISKKMTQGNIISTGNTYDVAIEGKGFFIVGDRSTNEVYYTRAGNFQMAEDGLLETQSGQKVLGLTPQANNIISSNQNEKQFNRGHTEFIIAKTIGNENFIQTINTRTSDYKASAQDIGESGNNLRKKDDLLLDIEVLLTDYKNKIDLYASNSTAVSTPSKAQITKVDFSNSLSDLNDKNDRISITIDNAQISQVFDTNVQTTLEKLSDKISRIQGLTSSVDTTSGELSINSLIPGKNVVISEAAINSNFSPITNTQNAVLGSGIGVVNSARDALKEQIELANGKLMEITNTIYPKQGGLGVNEIQLKLANLQLSENTFGKIEIVDGNVFLNDDNNSFLVGRLQTATFINEHGLIPSGDNLYRYSKEAGTPVNGEGVNKLITNSIELSTATLNNSLTNILVYQAAFEANSKSITTSDEMLKTAIELRK